MSIMGYFKHSGFDTVVSVFEEECPEATLSKSDEKKFLTNLEKKWRSIIRLRQKIAKLEAENDNLQEELDSFKSGTKVSTEETTPKKVKYVCEIHREQVLCVKFFPTPTKPYFASCSEDKLVILWDYSTGRMVKNLRGHKALVEWVDFSPQGKYLASCGEDTTIILWDVESLKMIGKPIQAHDHNVSCVVWDSSGDYFYSASRDKTIKKWKFENKQQVKIYNAEEKGHSDWIKRVIISPDGTSLASCGLDQTIHTWNIESGEIEFAFRDHENAIESIAYSSATADQNIISCLEEPEDQKLAKSKKSELKEDMGGMFLASACRDKSIMVWFLVSGVCVRVIKGHDNWVRSLKFHPSGRFLVSASDDKSVRLWDLKKNFRVQQKQTDAHKSFILCLDWHKALPCMITGGVEGEIKIWECK